MLLRILLLALLLLVVLRLLRGLMSNLGQRLRQGASSSPLRWRPQKDDKSKVQDAEFEVVESQDMQSQDMESEDRES